MMKLLHTFFSIILVGRSLAVRVSHNHSQRESAVVVTYDRSQAGGAGGPASSAAAVQPASAALTQEPGSPGSVGQPGGNVVQGQPGNDGSPQSQVASQQRDGESVQTSTLTSGGSGSSTTSSSGSQTDSSGAGNSHPQVPPAKVPEVPKEVVPEKEVPVPAQKNEEVSQNQEQETAEKTTLKNQAGKEQGPNSTVSLPKADIDISGPKVDVDVPDVDVKLPKGDVDVSLPKVEGDLKGGKGTPENVTPEQLPPAPAALKGQGPEGQQTASGSGDASQGEPEAGGVSSSPSPKEPAPAEPKEPAPTSPKEPAPTTPKEPAPTDPKEPAPTTPKEPAPTTPKEPAPTTPKQPAPTDPKEPAPTTPKEPAPTTPKEPAPTTPKQPAPTTPKEPAPTTPKEPAPTSPKEPAPTTPKEPAPTTPKQPVPTSPKAKLQPESHEENIKLRPDQIQQARENEGILHVTHGQPQRDEASSSSGVTNGVTTQVPISQTSVEHPPAPEKPTLETLVGSGTICHKQQILSNYLQNEINHGPMKETFNPMKNTPQVLQKCREMSKKRPSVCKSGTLTTQPLCATLNLTKTIGNYFTYGVCTVEAALNQMYHKRYTGTFIANDMNYYMTILKKVSTFMPEAQKTYGDSLKILEHLQKLFLDAEQALISPEVQAVLYKRWSLLDTVLCGIASGSQNEVLDNVNANSADQTAEAVVDLEDFIYQATNVFMKAYEPFVELVSVLQKQVLKAALELNKEEFANKVRELLKNIAEKHNPLIPVGSLEIMKQIPHAGLDAKEVQAVASSMPSVSLVQRNSRSSTSQNEDTVTATEAINTALLSVNIFKVKDNSVLPEMDVDRVKAMVREALLNLSEEEMVAKLIVQPQAAIRVFYDTLISLVPLPNSDKNWVQENKIWLAQFANIANVVEEKFNAARHAISGLAQQRPASMLQVKNDARAGSFLIQSRPGGANIETAVSTFVEPLPFQQKLEPMAYVKAFSNATFAGTVGVIFIAVFSIM